MLTYLIQGGERTLHGPQPALVKLKLNRPQVEHFAFRIIKKVAHRELLAEVELPLGDYLIFPDGKTRSERVRLDQYEVGGYRHVCVFASSQLQLLTSPES